MDGAQCTTLRSIVKSSQFYLYSPISGKKKEKRIAPNGFIVCNIQHPLPSEALLRKGKCPNKIPLTGKNGRKLRKNNRLINRPQSTAVTFDI